MVPAGTPKPVIATLNEALRKTMASPDVKEKLASIGGNLNVGSPEEMGALLTNETARWQKLAKDTNIKVD